MTKPDSSALVRLLRERHPLPKWAFFPELRNSNGFVKNPRTIDAAAFNTWPSGRGLRVAYEVKVTRHDYARELDQPDKRAWAESHFPQCYFVAPHGLIDPTTLPDGWGLLEATKDLGKLRAKKLAPPRKVADLPYSGLLVLLRRACDQLHQEREQTFYLNRREVGRKDLQEIVRKRVAHHQERLDEATKDFQNRARALLKLREPLAYLARRAGRFSLDGCSVDDVETFLRQSVAHELKSKLHTIRHAHEGLTALLSEMEAPDD